MAQFPNMKLEIHNVKRPVIATKTERNPYPEAKDELQGYHHMFYADADGDPCAIIEDIEGIVLCLPLAYWHYRFIGRNEIDSFDPAPTHTGAPAGEG